MRRIRRVSVEVIRRELSLSLTRAVATSATGHHDMPPANEPDPSANSSQTTLCLSCSSPLFLLPAGLDGGVAVTQWVLEAHGIHSQLSTTGELLVCARSFEFLAEASGVANLLGLTRMERPSTDLTDDRGPCHD